MDLPFTSRIFLSPLAKSETLPTTTFMRSIQAHPAGNEKRARAPAVGRNGR